MKKNLIIRPELLIREAMILLNKTAEKCLIVVDNEQKLLGTLSDGDIRKAILNGMTINKPIENIYNIQPRYFQEGSVSKEEVKKTLLESKLSLIPMVDMNLRVVNAMVWEDIFGNDGNFNRLQKMKVPVVIMAGGKGMRLEPFTHVLPKSLVPIHGKTVIEHIIERFVVCGVDEYYMTVNYKSRIIKAFFEELQPSYSVSFVDEKAPLGTAGSLVYLKDKIQETFMVTNCDIIIDTDYSEVLKFHHSRECAVTLVASTKNYVIPYGTCELNNEGYLEKIKEKPEYHFLVNTGLYVMEPDLLEMIPYEKIFHMTHLLEEVKSRGMKVGIYPVSEEAWMDVGQWSEFKRTVEYFESFGALTSIN